MGFGIGFFVGGLPISEAATRIGCTFVPVGTGASDRLLSSSRAHPCGFADLHAVLRHVSRRIRADEDEPRRREPRHRALVSRRETGRWGPVDTQKPRRGLECAGQRKRGKCGRRFRYTAPNANTGRAIISWYLIIVILEIIDPASGAVRSLTPGSNLKGEMVFTHIDRECVPLLRFRTYDQVEVDTRPCPCGRTGPRASLRRAY